MLGKTLTRGPRDAPEDNRTSTTTSTTRPRGDAEGSASRAGPTDLLGGIVRYALYSALPRRKRRPSTKYALGEARNAGRLERVYPELVHHFSQADVPEKTVEYALKLAEKSLDAFSAEDAVRVSKTALDYLEDAEDAEDRKREGEARLLLAQGHRLAGNIDAALREGEAAIRVFEAEKQTARAAAGVLLVAETAWQARRVDDARQWAERGIETARSSGDASTCGLLSLADTLAIRGSMRSAATRPRSRSQSGGKSGRGELKRGQLSSRSLTPSRGRRALRPTGAEASPTFTSVVTTDPPGTSLRRSAEMTFEGEGLAVVLHWPGVVFSDVRPWPRGRQGLARAVHPALEGPDAPASPPFAASRLPAERPME